SWEPPFASRSSRGRTAIARGARKHPMAANRKRQIAVLGAGAWGTALASLAARPGGEEETEVTLWARDAAHVTEMRATGINARHLPGVPLLSNVHPVAEPVEAQGAELVLAVVPAQALRPVLEIFAPHITAGGAPGGVFAQGVGAPAAPGL